MAKTEGRYAMVAGKKRWVAYHYRDKKSGIATWQGPVNPNGPNMPSKHWPGRLYQLEGEWTLKLDDEKIEQKFRKRMMRQYSFKDRSNEAIELRKKLFYKRHKYVYGRDYPFV